MATLEGVVFYLRTRLPLWQNVPTSLGFIIALAETTSYKIYQKHIISSLNWEFSSGLSLFSAAHIKEVRKIIMREVIKKTPYDYLTHADSLIRSLAKDVLSKKGGDANSQLLLDWEKNILDKIIDSVKDLKAQVELQNYVRQEIQYFRGKNDDRIKQKLYSKKDEGKRTKRLGRA